MNINPDVESTAISVGLVKLEPRTTTCILPSSSKQSIFCPTLSATYNLSPIQSTAIATGDQVPGNVISCSCCPDNGLDTGLSCWE